MEKQRRGSDGRRLFTAEFKRDQAQFRMGGRARVNPEPFYLSQ